MITSRGANNKSLDKQLAWMNFLKKFNLPDIMPQYSSKAYWEARYEMEEYEAQDWYVEYKDLANYFSELLNTKMEILQLGSGNSKLIDKLWENGYQKLTGSDFSWKLINQRKQQQKMLNRKIKWQILDVTKQWPKKKNLNCIIEKAVLDCLPVNQMSKALQIIYDALPAGGLFIHISNAKPQKRIKLSQIWDVRIYELPKTSMPLFKEIDKNSVYYLYCCYK